MNSFQKFFRDYPIVWIVIIALLFGLGIGYWCLKLRPIVKNQAAEIKPVKSATVKPIPVFPKQPERSVKITPVSVATPLVATAQKISQTSLRGGRKADADWLSGGRPLGLPVPALSEKDVKSFPKSAPRISASDGRSGEAISDIEIASVAPLPRNDVKPQIVFVIDDLGYNKRQVELLFSIRPPLTIAILPRLAYSKYFAEEGKKHGFETILHQPLEPENKNEDPGPGVITADMTIEQIKAAVEKNLSTVPDVIGVNNHMGSQATKDRRVMYVFGKELKKRNLFFLDSMTHPESVANRVTFALGIPTVKRDVFLDNEDNYDSIMNQIQETTEVAKANGKAVAIGHIRKNTLQAIKDSLPKLEADGFEIVSLKDLLKGSVIARSPEGTTPVVRTADGR